MKKLIYALVVLSMLVAAFGVPGFGVRTAAAAAGFQDNGGNATDTTLPDANVTTNMFGDVNAGGNQGGCSAVAVFGAYQIHMRSDDPSGSAHFIRARIVSTTDTGSYQWAVLIRNAATNVEIGCAVAASGVVDLTVPVEANVDVIITIANIGFYVPTGNLEYFIDRNYSGPGLIIDMQADTGNATNRTVRASTGDTTITATAAAGGQNVFFLDAEDGTYNLGIVDTDLVPIVTYYPGVAVPGYIQLRPEHDAVIPLTVDAKDELGADLVGAQVHVTPNDGGLNTDMVPGSTNGTGDFLFLVNPGYLWDVGVFTFGLKSYFLVELAINPTLGTLVFDLSVNTPAWVSQCQDNDYDTRMITVDPPGTLQDQTVLYIFVIGNACGAGHNSVEWFISPDMNYEATIQQGESGWYYEYAMETWNFAANVTAPGYQTTYGDIPFLTTPVPNATSAELYALPLAAGEVALGRGAWTDQDGNVLADVTAPDNVEADCVTGAAIVDTGGASDEIAPCYNLEDVSNPQVNLANDWDTTDLGPVTEVGRYRYERALQYGPNLTVPAAPGGWFVYDDLFAITPADMGPVTHWAWPWVMSMYEYGLTNGLDFTTYGVDQTVTRAQMATFLARVLEAYGLPATGTAAEFADIPTTYWAHDEILHLRDYGLTTGTNWCNGQAVVNTFCPEAFVTRAEMAKFIETTFRGIHAMTGFDFWWPEDIGVPVFGATFIDVPGSHWAVVWIDELFYNLLTDGCRRDGLTLYYCPDDLLTRGQMAKFIIRAIQPDGATEGFWPILAPSK